MGPITLFDKSFLQMLSLDEASVFDALYSAVICPIFYTEVLAGLSKDWKDGRSADGMVESLAHKTPVLHSSPNMTHTSLCLLELLGGHLELRRVPVLPGGVPVRTEDGVGLVYRQSPEAKAFDRWQRGEFLELEREFASQYRASLTATDHAALAKLAKDILAIHDTPRDEQEAYAIAKEAVAGRDRSFLTLRTAYALLGLPHEHVPRVHQRWTEAGHPPLPEFAPYTAHCLLVDAFFHVAIDRRLIAPERATNRIDMAYLYYLPFCSLFVSRDKLHRRTAPLFMGDGQAFVYGDDLKADLAALDRYYSALPTEQKEQGLFQLADYPPDDEAFLTTRLWRQMGHRTRPAADRDGHSVPKALATEILAKVKAMNELVETVDVKRATVSFTPGELHNPDHVVIQRMVPLRRGKWRLMSPEVEAASRAEGTSGDK